MKLASNQLLAPHDYVCEVRPWDLDYTRSIVEEFMLAQYAKMEENFGALLQREVPHPWPLHLMRSISRDGQEFLRLHDGREFLILRWYYASGTGLKTLPEPAVMHSLSFKAR